MLTSVQTCPLLLKDLKVFFKGLKQIGPELEFSVIRPWSFDSMFPVTFLPLKNKYLIFIVPILQTRLRPNKCFKKGFNIIYFQKIDSKKGFNISILKKIDSIKNSI